MSLDQVLQLLGKLGGGVMLLLNAIVGFILSLISIPGFLTVVLSGLFFWWLYKHTKNIWSALLYAAVFLVVVGLFATRVFWPWLFSTSQGSVDSCNASAKNAQQVEACKALNLTSGSPVNNNPAPGGGNPAPGGGNPEPQPTVVVTQPPSVVLNPNALEKWVQMKLPNPLPTDYISGGSDMIPEGATVQFSCNSSCGNVRSASQRWNMLWNYPDDPRIKPYALIVNGQVFHAGPWKDNQTSPVRGNGVWTLCSSCFTLVYPATPTPMPQPTAGPQPTPAPTQAGDHWWNRSGLTLPWSFPGTGTARVRTINIGGKEYSVCGWQDTTHLLRCKKTGLPWPDQPTTIQVNPGDYESSLPHP
jgi:hypothetical protein